LSLKRGVKKPAFPNNLVGDTPESPSREFLEGSGSGSLPFGEGIRLSIVILQPYRLTFGMARHPSRSRPVAKTSEAIGILPDWPAPLRCEEVPLDADENL